jgi:hypothetical protein
MPRSSLTVLLLVALWSVAAPAVRAQGSRFDRAQAAAIRGRPAEVVALLEGHAVGARELTLLIEAYRGEQDVVNACRHIATLLERHATSPQAGSYLTIRESVCPAATEPDPGPSPFEVAQDALRRGDAIAAVRALEGRTSNPRELGLLIETWRNIGNHRAACRNMALFTRRYGSAPQASSYRMMYARTCEE